LANPQNSRPSLPAFTIGSADGRDTVRMVGAQLHHLRDVLRLRQGAGVELIDAAGQHLIAQVAELEPHAALLRIVQRLTPAPTTPLILAIALIREPRMDYVIEKAVELGASEIQPLVCARSLSQRPGAERMERWRRLIAAATKQSLTDAAPVLKEPIDFGAFAGSLQKGMLGILCQASGSAIGTILSTAGRSGVAIAIGPEGDFTPGEVQTACRAGFALARINRNRLRSETAAVAALSLAAAALLELKEVD
jgi:16S rRNA (uracil1498-N3)-methyltransferase